MLKGESGLQTRSVSSLWEKDGIEIKVENEMKWYVRDMNAGRWCGLSLRVAEYRQVVGE